MTCALGWEKCDLMALKSCALSGRNKNHLMDTFRIWWRYVWSVLVYWTAVKCHLWSSLNKNKGQRSSKVIICVILRSQFLNQKLKGRLTDSPKNDRENQNWGHSKVIQRSFDVRSWKSKTRILKGTPVKFSKFWKFYHLDFYQNIIN